MKDDLVLSTLFNALRIRDPTRGYAELIIMFIKFINISIDETIYNISIKIK